MKKLLLASILSVTIFGLSGCSSDIDRVKDGILQFNSTMTVGDALDNYEYCQDPEWSSYETDKNIDVVKFSCKLTESMIVRQTKAYGGLQILNMLLDSAKAINTSGLYGQEKNIVEPFLFTQIYVPAVQASQMSGLTNLISALSPGDGQIFDAIQKKQADEIDPQMIQTLKKREKNCDGGVYCKDLVSLYKNPEKAIASDRKLTLEFAKNFEKKLGVELTVDSLYERYSKRPKEDLQSLQKLINDEYMYVTAKYLLEKDLMAYKVAPKLEVYFTLNKSDDGFSLDAITVTYSADGQDIETFSPKVNSLRVISEIYAGNPVDKLFGDNTWTAAFDKWFAEASAPFVNEKTQFLEQFFSGK